MKVQTYELFCAKCGEWVIVNRKDVNVSLSLKSKMYTFRARCRRCEATFTDRIAMS